MTYEERMKCVSYNKYIDEIVNDAPWIITKEFMDKYDIDYCAHHDKNMSENEIDGDNYPKQINKFFPIVYTEGISTTEIINRILERYKNKL